jgi:hypothetical protein
MKRALPYQCFFLFLHGFHRRNPIKQKAYRIETDKIMETISIQIKNPKAKQLLKDLESLNLITIKSKPTLGMMLEKLRKKGQDAPTLEEITSEVEKVRQMRYDKKA